jgi:subtilisin family serine protease
VAGIVAGNGQGAGQPFSGVARQASVIAVQVFAADGGTAFFSDILAALAHVDSLRTTFNIASVNMSLGGSAFASTCDGVFPSMATVIQNLRQHGIATVIASGNESQTSQISFPACISSAISVGSTRDGSPGFSGANPVDAVSLFSNVAPFLSLLAPGQVTLSSIPGGK